MNVKSTDKRHTELYKWIVQLRKDYRTRERDPSESTLTEEQISVLESVRFAFTTRGEEHWQKNYQKLKEYKADHGHVLVPRQCEIPGLGDWVRYNTNVRKFHVRNHRPKAVASTAVHFFICSTLILSIHICSFSIKLFRSPVNASNIRNIQKVDQLHSQNNGKSYSTK